MSPTIYIHWRYTLVRVNFSFLYIIHFCRNSIVFEMIHKMASSMEAITLFGGKTQHDVAEEAGTEPNTTWRSVMSRLSILKSCYVAPKACELNLPLIKGNGIFQPLFLFIVELNFTMVGAIWSHAYQSCTIHNATD